MKAIARSALCLLLVASPLIGCAAKKKGLPPPNSQREHRFKVTVKSGGKELSDPKAELVHRITVPKHDVSKLLAGEAAVPFSGEQVTDTQGGIKGVKLIYSDSKPGPTFGLSDGDILTAVDKTPARDAQDLRVAVESLQKNGNSSFTFDRDGLPHKALLTIGE